MRSGAGGRQSPFAIPTIDGMNRELTQVHKAPLTATILGLEVQPEGPP
jgi:hypothetical protein